MAYHLKNKSEKWIKNTRALCVDHGSKTLGLAICDSMQSLVTPLETIHRKKWKLDKERLNNIINEFDITQVIFGYPLNMDGTKGARCQSVRDFVSLVEETWPHLTVFFWDETLSTHSVDNFLDNMVDYDVRLTRDKRKQFKDSLAAQIILEEALTFIRTSSQHGK